MTVIKSLSEGLDFANQHRAVMVSGYEIKRTNGSEECKAIFNVDKKSFAGKVFIDTHRIFEKVETQSSFKTRNITLWNKIDTCQSAFGRALLKSMYAFSFIILLPVVDQLIGFFRNDHQIVTSYKNNVDRFQESPIIHAQSHALKKCSS